MRRKTALTTTTAPVAVLGTIALSLTGGAGEAAAEVPHTSAQPQTRTSTSERIAGAVTAASTIVAAARSASTYTVVRGDTVSAIAARHGLRTADVLAWNDLGWKSIIRPGDVLKLSAGSAADGASTATRSAAKKSTPSDLRPAGSHTVRGGDTLWEIARSEGVSLAALLRANDLTASSIIYPGEKLIIPGSERTSDGRKKSTSTKTSAGEDSPARDATSGTAASVSSAPLDAEQIRGVKTIISVGRELGVPEKGIAIALATAMVESWIRNVDYGTYDSLGLFQQRPSTGWGTAEQVRDPRRATAAFFGGPSDPNGWDTRGLLDIPGWEDMDFADAAQAVQISAYPHRYGEWESAAYGWLATYG